METQLKRIIGQRNDLKDVETLVCYMPVENVLFDFKINSIFRETDAFQLNEHIRDDCVIC